MAKNKKDKRDEKEGKKEKKEKDDVILMGAPSGNTKSFPKEADTSLQLKDSAEKKNTGKNEKLDEGVKIAFGDSDDSTAKDSKEEELPFSEEGAPTVVAKEHVGLGKMFLWLLTLFVAYLIIGQIFDFFGPTTLSLLALWPLLLLLIGLSLFKVKRRTLSHAIGFLVVIALFFTGAVLVFKGGSVVTINVADVSVTEERTVDPFTAVEFAGRGEVVVRAGERDAVVITADEAVIGEITTQNDGDTLKVGYGNTLWSLFLFEETTMRAEIIVSDLSRFVLSGIGDASLENVSSEKLDLSLSGEGSLSATGLEADEVVARLLGSGEITLGGTSNRTFILVPGDGVVDASELVSSEAAVKVTGNGFVTLLAEEALEASVEGEGEVVYIGTPELTGDTENDSNVYSAEEKRMMEEEAEAMEEEEELPREEDEESMTEDTEVSVEDDDAPVVKDPKSFLKDIDTTL